MPVGDHKEILDPGVPRDKVSTLRVAVLEDIGERVPLRDVVDSASALDDEGLRGMLLVASAWLGADSEKAAELRLMADRLPLVDASQVRIAKAALDEACEEASDPAVEAERSPYRPEVRWREEGRRDACAVIICATHHEAWFAVPDGGMAGEQDFVEHIMEILAIPTDSPHWLGVCEIATSLVWTWLSNRERADLMAGAPR